MRQALTSAPGSTLCPGQRPPGLGRPIKEREAIALLPRVCDRGTKKNAKGDKESWNGFKLHLDVNDCELPLSAVLTSASVHDSQVATPLMKLTSGKVIYGYDLMDATYDAAQIREQSQELDHVPIIDRNPRGQAVIPMAPHEALRYKRADDGRAKQRTTEGRVGRTHGHGAWSRQGHDAPDVRHYRPVRGSVA